MDWLSKSKLLPGQPEVLLLQGNTPQQLKGHLVRRSFPSGYKHIIHDTDDPQKAWTAIKEEEETSETWRPTGIKPFWYAMPRTSRERALGDLKVYLVRGRVVMVAHVNHLKGGAFPVFGLTPLRQLE